MKWIKAVDRLPVQKKFYNCTFEGLPIVYWIDGENIVLDGGLMDKGIWDRIFWLDESQEAAIQGYSREQILEKNVKNNPNGKRCYT